MVTGYERDYYNDVDSIERHLRSIAESLEKIAKALSEDESLADVLARRRDEQ